jgi:hypothetical protein
LLNNYALIGVRHDNQNGNGAGAAYIYKRINSNWTKLSKILASDGGESDQFGYKVDLDEDIIAVGAPIQYAGGFYCGAVYLYTDFTTGVFDSKEPISINEYHLYQNYPNPFNPSTKIQFQIKEASFASLKVYDAIGNEIVALFSEDLPEGKYEVEFDANELTSGVYFYQLKTGSFVQTKKMLLIK